MGSHAALALSLVLTGSGPKTAAAEEPPAGVVELKPYDPVQLGAGKLVRVEVPGEDQSLRLVLNGEKVLYRRDGSLELAYLLPKANAAGDDAVLIAVGSDVPAEKACGKYLFVTVHADATANATDTFGDCSDQFTVQRKAALIFVRFGKPADTWVYDNGKLAQAPAAEKPLGKAGKKH